jgi:hypothetical protein
VYHGKHGTRALKELGRSYLTLTQDSTRVMNRIKSVYRSWAIPVRARASIAAVIVPSGWPKLVEPGVRIRAEHLYQQLDSLEPVRQAARRELLRESRKHAAVKLLRQIPAIGPIRSALLVAILQTPHRFRPSASFGPTAVLPSRPMTAASTAWCAGNGTQPRAHHGAWSESKP